MDNELEEKLKQLKIGNHIKINGEDFIIKEKHVNEEDWAKPPYKNYYYHLNKDRYLNCEHHQIRFFKIVEKKWLGFLKYQTCKFTPIETYEYKK